MSPEDVPSSQAPIPEREVFWQMDTPESRRTRERMAEKLEKASSSPAMASSSPVNKLRLFAPRRNSKSSEGSEVHQGSDVLDALLKLNEEMNQSKENLEPTPTPVKRRTSTSQGGSRGQVGTSSNKRHDNGVMMEDRQPTVNVPETVASEFDDDDDDDFLLAASQVLDQEYSSSTPAQPVKPKTQFRHQIIPHSSAGPSKMKNTIPEVSKFPAFDEFDDSFDAVVSQMVSKESPVIKQTSSCVSRPNIHLPQVAQAKFFEDVNDSFDDLLSQMEEPEQQTTQVKSSIHHGRLQGAPPNPVLTHPPTAGESKGSFIRKHSSFGSPAREKKIVVQKFRSDSQILPKICSKEEIERKRKEALERRKVSSSSQKRRL